MEIYNIRLPKDSTVGDVLDDLRMKVKSGTDNVGLFYFISS